MTSRQRDHKGRFVTSTDTMEDDEPVIVATSSGANNTTRTSNQEGNKMLCPALALTCESLCAQAKALTMDLLKAESRLLNLQSHLTEGSHPKYYTWKADPMWPAEYKSDDIITKIAQLKKDSYKKLIKIDLEAGQKTVRGIKDQLAEAKQSFINEADFIADQLKDNGVKDYESQVNHDKELFQSTLDDVVNKARTKFTHERVQRDKRRNKLIEQRAEQNVQQALETNADNIVLSRLDKLEANSRKQDAEKKRLEAENKKLAAEMLKLKAQGKTQGKSVNPKTDGANQTESPSPSSEQPKKRRRPKSSRKGDGTGKAQEAQRRNRGPGKGNQN